MTVTFLFSDIERSTDLVRRVGDGAFAAIRADHHRLLRQAFEAHGGEEVDTAGDGFFVAFGSARDAVRAAVSAQQALAAHAWPDGAPVRVRMGLHTTEPHRTVDGYVGLGVHRAARICDAAHGGQILASQATAGIVEDAELSGVELADLGEHSLKDLPRRQRLYQMTAPGLPKGFDRPRTREAAAKTPGVATFLATDLVRWHQFVRRLGDEVSAAVVAGYYAAMTKAIEDANGTVLERVGDTVLAVFGQPGEALWAAIGARAALAGIRWPAGQECELRIAVHSGRWSGDPRRPAASTALVRLHRLGQLVEPGQVLVSHATAALLEGDRSGPDLRDLGERKVPEFDEPVHLYELALPAA
ncbi:MAG TPA: adenylate/guanylate cyclase domain-containing protein [Candidatus Limnocylindrales bacterium]